MGLDGGGFGRAVVAADAIFLSFRLFLCAGSNIDFLGLAGGLYNKNNLHHLYGEFQRLLSVQSIVG